MTTISESVINSCNQELQNFSRDLDAIQAVIISTVDGHFVTSYSTTNISGKRLSAMNSSLLALGETLAAEVAHDICNFVISDNAKGYIVSLKIKSVYLLTSVAQRRINLGLLLSHSQACAQTLSALLP